MLIPTLAVLASEECKMIANTSYKFNEAKYCIEAPKLTSTVFSITQQTLENLFGMHALRDWLGSSASIQSNVNITSELEKLREKFQDESLMDSTPAY